MSKSTVTQPSRKSEPKSLITPEFQGSEYNTLIFPEWSDRDLNAETWEATKYSIKPTNDSAASPNQSMPGRKSSSPQLPFRDRHSYTLPAVIAVYKWKKPEVAFPGKTLVIYKDSSLNCYANFIDGSRHLFQSNFMRSFIASIGSLEHMGYTSPWPMEGTSPNFTPNTLRKYVLRLFWMGSWRRIVIDDFLPVDRQNHVLLPTVERVDDIIAGSHINYAFQSEPTLKNDNRNAADKDIIELWPFLLCKGLLKIANLTWSEHREIVDFNVVHSLTGWFCQKLNTINLNPNELWDIVVAYTKHYKWADDKDNKPSKASMISVKETSGVKRDKTKKGEANVSMQMLKPETIPYCVLLHVSDMKNLDGATDKIPAIAPCWAHLFLVSMIRTTPLEKPEYKPVMEQWKRFRWINWARDHGIYTEEQSSLKVLQMVDFFKQVNDHVIYRDVSLPLLKSSIKGSVDSFKSVKKDKKANESSEQSNDTKTTRKEKVEEVAFRPPPDPSFWADFVTLSPFVEYALIFFRPAMFSTYYVVTDIQENPDTIKDKTKLEYIPRKLIWPYGLKTSRNEPIYIFFDSLDYQTVIVCLNHAGNREILEQKCLLVHCDMTSLWQKKFSINERAKLRTHASIMFEKYDWETDTYGELAVGLYARGMQALVISISPGRTIMRFWVNSSSSYSVDLLSDYAFEIGNLEYILECMPAESERFQQMCFDFGTSFGNLVNSFGMQDYIENLRAFYKSYKPEGEITKKECETLDEEMFAELEVLLKQQYPDCGDIMFALRVLFLKPAFGLDCRSNKKENDRRASMRQRQDLKKSVVIEEPQWDDMECFSDQYISSSSSEDEVKIEKARERAACTIQTFFKMIYAQTLRSCQNTNNPNYSNVFENLKKVYRDMFNVNNCISIFPGLFRKLLFRKERLSGFLEKYTFWKDLRSVVNCQCLSETIPCNVNSWVLIGRYVFFVNSPYEEPVKICLFCTLDKFVLRVFNNDTDEEVPNCLNDTLVAKYSCNSKGYTILAYGWNQTAQSAKFKINLVTLKKADIPLLIIPPFKQSLVQLADVYHYNVNNVIGKYVFTINQDTSLSLRMSCTYPKVIVKLRCLDNAGKLIREMVGRQTIILPLLQLKCEEDENHRAPLAQKSSSNANITINSSTSKRKSATDRESVGTRTSRISKSSRMSRTSRISSTHPETARKSCQKSNYFVEAYVLNDSWPLTKEEWLESMKLAERNLLAGATTSKVLLKKLSNINKSCAHVDYDKLPNPKWRLQVIHNAENPVTLKFDNKRAMEIGNAKLSWYEDSSRYKDSKKLRNNYLRTFSNEEDVETYMSSVVYNTSDNSHNIYDSGDQMDNFLQESVASVNDPNTAITPQGSEYIESRSIIKPKTSSIRKLPELDYNLYAYPSSVSDSIDNTGESESWKDDSLEMSQSNYQPETWKSDSGILKKPEDYLEDERNLERAMEDFELYHNVYINDMLIFRNNSLKTSSMLEAWFDGIRIDSANLIGQAYRMRATFIDILEEYEKELNAYEELSEELLNKNSSREEAPMRSSRNSKTRKSSKTKSKIL